MFFLDLGLICAVLQKYVDYLSGHMFWVRTPLYDVANIFGRAWATDPRTDQGVGGLITWMLGAMMSVVAILVVLDYFLRDKHKATAE